MFRLEIGHAENVEQAELKRSDGNDANDKSDGVGQTGEQ